MAKRGRFPEKRTERAEKILASLETLGEGSLMQLRKETKIPVMQIDSTTRALVKQEVLSRRIVGQTALYSVRRIK